MVASGAVRLFYLVKTERWKEIETLSLPFKSRNGFEHEMSLAMDLTHSQNNKVLINFREKVSTSYDKLNFIKEVFFGSWS